MLQLEVKDIEQWFSKCGPQANSISIIWGLVRKENSQVCLDLLNRKLEVREHRNLFLTSTVFDAPKV